MAAYGLAQDHTYKNTAVNAFREKDLIFTYDNNTYKNTYTLNSLCTSSVFFMNQLQNLKDSCTSTRGNICSTLSPFVISDRFRSTVVFLVQALYINIHLLLLLSSSPVTSFHSPRIWHVLSVSFLLSYFAYIDYVRVVSQNFTLLTRLYPTT